MIQLKTNQSSQSHTTSTENRNRFSIQPLHVSIADFYTQTFLIVFAHRGFYTQTIFTHRHFYTQKLLKHRGFYTQKLLHTGAFTHRSFYTQTLLHTDAFTHRRFYTQTLLHTEAFTHRPFYTQTRLHTEAFTHRLLYTQTLLHTDALHTDPFTHRPFYTQKLLHTEAFTHRNFYTQTLLHTEAFTQQKQGQKCKGDGRVHKGAHGSNIFKSSKQVPLCRQDLSRFISFFGHDRHETFIFIYCVCSLTGISSSM